MIFEKLLGRKAPGRIHWEQFPGEDSHRGTLTGGGGFTEGGLSCYQFPELRSAFKHVGIMTVVIKDTIFDK